MTTTGDTDYALFSLVNDELRHTASGDGGLDDLEDQFNDGKIQYAFVRVKDPSSKLNKFVLINWVRCAPLLAWLVLTIER